MVLHISGHYFLPASLRRLRTSLYRNFPHTANPLNYTSEFRELFEDTHGDIILIIIFFFPSRSMKCNIDAAVEMM